MKDAEVVERPSYSLHVPALVPGRRCGFGATRQESTHLTELCAQPGPLKLEAGCQERSTRRRTQGLADAAPPGRGAAGPPLQNNVHRGRSSSLVAVKTGSTQLVRSRPPDLPRRDPRSEIVVVYSDDLPHASTMQPALRASAISTTSYANLELQDVHKLRRPLLGQHVPT